MRKNKLFPIWLIVLNHKDGTKPDLYINSNQRINLCTSGYPCSMISQFFKLLVWRASRQSTVKWCRGWYYFKRKKNQHLISTEHFCTLHLVSCHTQLVPYDSWNWMTDLSAFFHLLLKRSWSHCGRNPDN